MLGHGVSSLTVTGADDALLVGFGGACAKGGHFAVALGVAGLNFFLGVALFLFSVESPFLILGLDYGSGGLNWLTSAGIIGPILFSTSRKVFIFLTVVGYGQSFIIQGVHLISWVVLSLLKMCIPCIDVTLTSMSTTSTGSLHLKNLCRKLHSGWSRHAISKMKCSRIYTVSKLDHIIPCFIIIWKFHVSLLIILLTFILSHILIMTNCGNFILLLLNDSLILSQFISKVSHK